LITKVYRSHEFGCSCRIGSSCQKEAADSETDRLSALRHICFYRATMVHQFRRQPLKGLYLAFEIITTLFFRLPSWILGNLPRELRPRPSWSLKKSVLIRALGRFNVVIGRWDEDALFWLRRKMKPIVQDGLVAVLWRSLDSDSRSGCEACLGRAYTSAIKCRNK